MQHRSRVAVDPTRPNLRQVHLLDAALLAELADLGLDVGPGGLGENSKDPAAPRHSRARGGPLQRGRLRDPCVQIDAFRPGALRVVAGRDADGTVVRRAGVMATVLRGGAVRAGDVVTVEFPAGPLVPLQPV